MGATSTLRGQAGCPQSMRPPAGVISANLPIRKNRRIFVRPTSRTKRYASLLPQPGSTIDPRNAVGRRGTTARARDELHGDNNLGLNDPRRMGKTVWLDLFCADPGDGLTSVKIDFEGVRTSEEFLVRTVAALDTHRSLPRQAADKLRTLFDGVEVDGPIKVKIGVSTRAATDLLSDTIGTVDDHLGEGTLLVIAMDEVPLAIGNIARNEGPEAASQLLQTLRGLRRRGSRLRWIVCGSVGFHHILRSCETTEGVLNDLINLPLGPLQAAEGRELSQRLFLGIDRAGDEEAVDALVEHSGGIPFLIHALAHGLYEAGTGPVAARDVADAFVAFMDSRDESRAVTHLVTRLDPLYGDRARVAEEVLDRVAIEHSLDTAGLQADGSIIDDLIDDHYLIEHDRTVCWRYDVLRRIWVHRRRLC